MNQYKQLHGKTGEIPPELDGYDHLQQLVIALMNGSKVVLPGDSRVFVWIMPMNRNRCRLPECCPKR